MTELGTDKTQPASLVRSAAELFRILEPRMSHDLDPLGADQIVVHMDPARCVRCCIQRWLRWEDMADV